MFLHSLQAGNPRLLDAAMQLHQSGELPPDSYAVDVEQFCANAAAILRAANDMGIRLYFMLKQLGRNPVLAQRLIDLGYAGAVTVDFKEAQVMMRHHIPLGNVGHLVQLPQAMLRSVIAYGAEVITVYSLEKARAIDRAAAGLGKVQDILIRVYDSGDTVYSGQTAGIPLDSLPAFLQQVCALPNVRVAGVTSFPCFLYSEAVGDIAPTPNLQTVLRAVGILRQHGIEPRLINTPSTTCCRTLELMAQYGGNCGEPGHGLTATTQAHLHPGQPELPCVAYVSEISHNFDGLGYCYGGGYYRRSHVQWALVGTDAAALRQLRVLPPSVESIDYHFGLDAPCTVGETVVMAFRYQVFVTRSDVVLVDGIRSGRPRILGIFDSLGNQK